MGNGNTSNALAYIRFTWRITKNRGFAFPVHPVILGQPSYRARSREKKLKSRSPQAFSLNTAKKRIRLSFAAGPEICGDAIGKIEDGTQGLHMVIMPYRLRLMDAANDSGKISVLERRRNAWGFKQTAPAQTGVKFWLRALRAVSFPLSFFP